MRGEHSRLSKIVLMCLYKFLQEQYHRSPFMFFLQSFILFFNQSIYILSKTRKYYIDIILYDFFIIFMIRLINISLAIY